MTGIYKNYKVEMNVSRNLMMGKYRIKMWTPTGKMKKTYSNDSVLYDEFRDSIEEGNLKKKMFEKIRSYINNKNKEWR